MIIITMVDIEVVVDNNNTQENRAIVFGCLSNSVDKKSLDLQLTELREFFFENKILKNSLFCLIKSLY